MPGYILMEHSNMKPFKEDGITLFENKLGILDFIRETSQEPFPFPRYYRLCITGVEDVLFWAGEEEKERALEIKSKLKNAAQELERKLLMVQVVFQGRLMRGDTIWLEYRGRRIPINLIFGNPQRQSDAQGNVFYTTSFNLTNGI